MRLSGGQGVCGDLFLDVNVSRMLTQIVKPREPSVAVALKWPLSSVLTYVTIKMLTSSEAVVARWVAGTGESLTLFSSRSCIYHYLTCFAFAFCVVKIHVIWMCIIGAGLCRHGL